MGGVPNDRAELILEALAALLETKELQNKKCPRGHFSSRPPVQIHVHEDAKTGRMTVQTDAGGRELSRAKPSGCAAMPPFANTEVATRPQSRRECAEKCWRAINIAAGRRVADGRGFWKYITSCHDSKGEAITRKT